MMVGWTGGGVMKCMGCELCHWREQKTSVGHIARYWCVVVGLGWQWV